VYYKKGLASMAVSTLREGEKQNPNSPLLHYHLGLAYLKNNDPAAARKSLQRALQIDQNFAGADDAKRALASIG
jgi:Tfp pilus assembly protein PilF